MIWIANLFMNTVNVSSLIIISYKIRWQQKKS
jgi:hypothetical protein